MFPMRENNPDGRRPCVRVCVRRYSLGKWLAWPTAHCCAQKLLQCAIFAHTNALLAHMVHSRCTPRVCYVHQQHNMHPQVYECGAQRRALTHRVCMRCTARVVYTVSAIYTYSMDCHCTKGQRFSCSVHCQCTHRFKVHVDCKCTHACTVHVLCTI